MTADWQLWYVCAMADTLSSCDGLPARRRQIQLQSTGGTGPWQVARAIMGRDGLPGFYRGFLPNALKNLPNKGAPVCCSCCTGLCCHHAAAALRGHKGQACMHDGGTHGVLRG